MNAFFQRGFEEYQRHGEMRKSFVLQTARIRAALIATDANRQEAAAAVEADSHLVESERRRALLLLMPLVEIAWADGRVARREMEAILQAAEAYGLAGDKAGHCELMSRLLTRPAPPTVGKMWRDFRRLFAVLPSREREIIRFGLLFQARFVAEQSSDSLIEFLSGRRVCADERAALQQIAEQLENAAAAVAVNSLAPEKAAATAAGGAAVHAEAAAAPITLAISTNSAASQSNVAAETTSALRLMRQTNDVAPTAMATMATTAATEKAADSDGFDELLALVPLVKTAWAEGRVTRRERRVIFEAAGRRGVKPGSAAYRRLSEWLERHPTDEFYDSALSVLRSRWLRLGGEEKERRRFALLDECARVAEASGGSKDFPAGGAKICDEEIAAVKRIARKLNGAAA